jgi:hypothetical protein
MSHLLIYAAPPRWRPGLGNVARLGFGLDYFRSYAPLVEAALAEAGVEAEVREERILLDRGATFDAPDVDPPRRGRVVLLPWCDVEGFHAFAALAGEGVEVGAVRGALAGEHLVRAHAAGRGPADGGLVAYDYFQVPREQLDRVVACVPNPVYVGMLHALLGEDLQPADPREVEILRSETIANGSEWPHNELVAYRPLAGAPDARRWWDVSRNPDLGLVVASDGDPVLSLGYEGMISRSALALLAGADAEGRLWPRVNVGEFQDETFVCLYNHPPVVWVRGAFTV